MAKNQNEEMDLEQEEMTVTLTLDDDSEVECVVLTIFEAGDRDYIALLPTEGARQTREEVYLYQVTKKTQTATRAWTTSRTMTSTK